MNSLPVYEILPQLHDCLTQHSSVIVHAPPGAGKTTVIPLELLKFPLLESKKIIMLEPRRLAATNAARWMASKIGEEAGKTVGYTIRSDRRVSTATRIEVVTEGILTRRLQLDPWLTGIGAVIFDEFHERNLYSDFGLALCLDIQQGLRDDLKIILMSATLDCEPLSRIMNGAPIISSKGRTYPVDIRYCDTKGDSAESTAGIIRQALRETEGDILAFLPGAGEILACQRHLSYDLPQDIRIVPLYGDMPFAAQEDAIKPSPQRKVVLATNIAETSLTIEGIRVVIDSGWSRQLRYDPVSGLNRLVTVRVSEASADQRAGRAGRTAPGICYRLWSEHAQRSLVPFTPPEIRTADLTPLALDLAAWGVTDAGTLKWVDPPHAGALVEGRNLLKSLGAVDSQGLITSTGREMAALPLHPRLSHMLLLGKKHGLTVLAADIAALLSERDIFRRVLFGKNETSASDVLDRVEALGEWRARKTSPHGWIDDNACRVVDKEARALRKSTGATDDIMEASAETVGILLASAFPDRIAQQRNNDPSRYLLANGRGAVLSRRSAVHNSPYLVAVAVEGGEGSEGVIHVASTLDIASIYGEFPHLIKVQRKFFWDRQQNKVLGRKEELFQALLLNSKPFAPSLAEMHAVVIQNIHESGVALLTWGPETVQFRDRVHFLAKYFPEGAWPDLSDEQLTASVEDWLSPWLMQLESAAAVSKLNLLPPLQALLNRQQLQQLEKGAPTHLQVPSGSKIPLDYSQGGAPVLAVKLQELFGLAETPSVCWGRVPVMLHLLSPARRPLQVTQDLKNFWNTTYGDIKKELKGRYPKHPWPDDPWREAPTRQVKKRR